MVSDRSAGGDACQYQIVEYGFASNDDLGGKDFRVAHVTSWVVAFALKNKNAPRSHPNHTYQQQFHSS
jgi:hypothetical protein